MREAIWYLSFWAWVTLLNIIFYNYIHLPEKKCDFFDALFTIAGKWNQPRCALKDEWI